MNTTTKSKKWKIWIAILIAFTLLITAALYFISYKLEPMLDKKLKEGIAKASNGLYSLTYSDLNLDLTQGNIRLENLNLQNDSTVYLQLDKAEKAPNALFEATAQQLSINGVSLWGILINKRIEISDIGLDSLKGKVVLNERSYNNKKESKDPYSIIKESFKSLEIQKFRAERMQIVMQDHSKQGNKPKIVKGIDLAMENFLIDENSGNDSTRFLYSKDLSIHIPEFKTTLDGAPYSLGFKELKFSAKDKDTRISKLELLPTIDLESFAKRDKLNKPRMELSLDSVWLTGIDIQKLWKEKRLLADSAHISKGQFDLAKDKRYQLENVSKIGQSPAQQLMKVNQTFSIKTVKVNGIDLSYAQISDKYARQGKIDFKNIRGTLKNVTNDKALLRRNKDMTADLVGNVYGKGTLSAFFTFDMLSKAGDFSYKGGLTAMTVSPYNRILEPLLNIRLAEGNIEKITFDMHGNDAKNWGKFTFDYNRLKVDVLKDPEKGPGKKGILSFIANRFFINDSNPDANGKYHVAQVEYNRVPEHPFFKVIWKSLLQGIIECTGTDPKYLPGI
ncbi:AsmA family protein [Sphingobacterium endophyticum]|uniref:hypothetical protein n=1 Tax=Sphingobacterium endophyticum TaxID=2546448 RepID=UPI0012E29A09|nr:hypothetical protein [Sphingobacterium endophyticum]